VIKTGTAYYRREISDNGDALLQWCLDGIELTGKSDKGPFLFSDGNDSSIFELSYRGSDFPDIAWVGPDNYAGVDVVGGVKCLLFKKQMPRIKESLIKRMTARTQDAALKDTLETTVWINSETRLPVQETMPGQRLIYKFLAAPNEQLTIPPAAAQEMQAWRAQKAVMNRPWPTP
jgi:hypothetical protein